MVEGSKPFGPASSHLPDGPRAGSRGAQDGEQGVCQVFARGDEMAIQQADELPLLRGDAVKRNRAG